MPQARTHNAQNQIVTVGAATLTSDNNGNLTKDQNGQQYLFDPWNRLTVIKNSAGVTIQTYGYDALGRRITENPGTIDHLYYSAAWQVLEERLGTNSAPTVQYVWCPCYVDAMIERDRDPTGGTTLTERLYVAHDANYNVTSLFDTSGAVQERDVYDPYGQVTFYDGSWIVRASSSVGMNYLWQGFRTDVGLGVGLGRGRVYSYTVSRWLQQDPIPSTNLYLMEGDQPVNGLDPSGLDAIQGPTSGSTHLSFANLSAEQHLFQRRLIPAGLFAPRIDASF